MTTDAEYNQCWERALILLGSRPHSVAELRRKLRARKFPAATVDRAVAELKRLKLLDDRQFAEEYCIYRHSSTRPLGRRRMLADLVRKGVANDLAAEVLDAFHEAAGTSELDRALEAGRRKWESLKARENDPLKLKQKLVRFLAGRGFDSHTSYEVLDRLQRRD